MKNRFVAIILSIALSFSLIPANVAVAASNKDISDLGDGVTYYNVDTENFDISTQLFIKDLLSAQNSQLGNKSIASLWQKLAYSMQAEIGTDTDNDKFKPHFTEVLAKGLAYNIGDFTSYNQNIDETIDNDDTYNVYSTGLTYTTSVASAASEIEKIVYDRYYTYGSRDKQTDAVASNTSLKSSTGTEDVFYYMTGAFKKSGTYKKGHYQALGVIFSDFTVSPIVPGDDSAYTTTSSTPSSTSSPHVADAKNDTDSVSTVQQEVSSTTTVVATNEINGSEEYHYGQSFSGGLEFGSEKGPVRGHIDIALDWEQVMSEGWSNSNSVEESETTVTTISKDMPAYTSMVLTQSNSELETTSTYDCPVVLEFAVTIVEYTLDPSSNSADPKTNIIATFDGNAREQLKNRAVTNNSLKDVSGLYWSTLYSHFSDMKNIVEKQMAVNAPMSYTGAVFSTVVTSKNLTFDRLLPLYSLNKVKTIETINEIHLTSGEYIFPTNIETMGYNTKNGEYYGFNSENGYWILLDENGNQITEDTPNPVATLETNAISGVTKLVAQTPGTAYLKYMIDEDCYYPVDKVTDASITCTKNADLSETVVIEIIVSEVAFTGSIKVSGSYQGIVDDAPLSLEKTGLELTVYDETGKELEPSLYPVIWEAQELENKGILVENNQISFTEEGTFHVGAKIGDVHSNWLEVTATEAAKLTEIIIPENLILNSGEVATYDLANVTVELKDQYGREFSSDETVTWHHDGSNTTIENGILTCTSRETPKIWVTLGDVTSNTMQVKYTNTVTSSRPNVTSIYGFVNRLSHEGGIVEFRILGKNLDKGLIKLISGDISCTVNDYHAFMEFPANTTDEDIIYTITSNTNTKVTTTVIVESAPKWETSDKTTATTNTNAVKTGDTSPIALISLTVLISGIIIAIIIRRKIKRL